MIYSFLGGLLIGVGVTANFELIKKGVLDIIKACRIPSTTETFTRKLYRVPYYFRGTLYYALHVMPRGPKRIDRITAIRCINDDSTELDVTEYIKAFIGPNEDFQQNMYTPNVFDYDDMTFHYSDGRVRSFKRNDFILLK